MAKVLYHVTMSLDGFIAGPEHSMDWMSQLSGGRQEEGMAVAGTLGAAIAGRHGYDAGRKAGGELYGGAYQGPIFVMTHRPPTDETDPAYTFLSGDIRPAVEAALRAAGGKDVLILGGTLAEQCITAGVLDEIFVHVAPVLLGDGIPFFRSTGPFVALEPISSTHEAGTTSLRFRVRR
jgi:dihydrofolate reductase